MPQQLLPQRDLALGRDGEKAHELATSCTSAYGSFALPVGPLAQRRCGCSTAAVHADFA
jgi:hypothetical protein